MCFSKKNGDGLKIEENPIICYKYLYKTEQFKKYKNKKDEFVSPFHTFFWKIGKQYSSGFKNSQIVEFKNSVIYNKNLFSAFLKKPKHPLILDGYLCICIIPKNSLYLVSSNNELVTSNLIIVKIIENGRNTSEGKEEILKNESIENNKQKRKKK